jgi:ABC-type transporter Mla MlaB component
MSWTLENGMGCTRLTLTDVVDVFDAKGLHHELVALAGVRTPVHVDLTDCRDLDSSILQLLLALRRAREAAGRSLALEGADGHVERLVARFVTAGADHHGLQPGDDHAGRS